MNPRRIWLVVPLAWGLGCLDPKDSLDPGPAQEDIQDAPGEVGTDPGLFPDDLAGPGPDGADLSPGTDCGPLECHDCFCEWGPPCGGCFTACDPVPPEVLDCSCCPAPPCQPPAFSPECGEVREFQCGFQASCEDGTLVAQWHHHWFCEGEERITDFECRSACPNGCPEGPIEDWPQNGGELLARGCFQCREPTDCEGLDHGACVGAWHCEAGRCTWVCVPPDCVAEGAVIPVIPDAPSCCPGLSAIPCDRPGPEETCEPCEGAAICARCGDRRCGPAENVCNCPEDCLPPCLGPGESFLGPETSGRCCEGLVPMPDCILTSQDCSCPKCLCFVCLACGDGTCGPYEHSCNCPDDCPTPEKCLETSEGPCQDDSDAEQDPAGKLEIQVRGHDLVFLHTGVLLNCCLRTTLCVRPEVDRLVIREHSEGTPCFCQCLIDLEATLPGVPSGTYEVLLYNDQQGEKPLFTTSVTVP